MGFKTDIEIPASFHAEDLVVACDVILGTMKQM